MNHCIHGATLNEYCPACEFDVRFLEEWTDFKFYEGGDLIPFQSCSFIHLLCFVEEEAL